MNRYELTLHRSIDIRIGFVRIIFVVSASESELREAFSFRSHFSSKDADNLSEIFRSLNNFANDARKNHTEQISHVKYFAKDARKIPREIFVHLFVRQHRIISTR